MPYDNAMHKAVYSGGGEGYVASRPVPVGGVIATFRLSALVREATRFTIQTGRDQHVDVEEVKYLNHSCVPTTFVDTRTGQVVALRPVAPGEQLTFFYPSTEWEMVEPFACACGHDDCLGTVSGASALPSRLLDRYAVNDHILELAAERDRDTVPVSVAG